MSSTTTTYNSAASEQPVAIRPHASFPEPQINPPHSSRPRPKHLQPLAIGQVIPRNRRHSGTYVRYPVTGNGLASQFTHSPSEDTPGSATSLATPSLSAVRQYYKDNNLRTAFQGPRSPRVPPNTPAYDARRASILTPTSLTAHFDKLAASSPVLARGELRSPIVLRSPNFARRGPPVGRPYRQRSIVDESRDMLLDNLPTSEICRLGSAVTPTSPVVGRRLSLPAKPPKDRLRDFGHLYLGNVLTSDVFVKALHISKVDQIGRRDSVMSNHSDFDSDKINVPKVGQEAEHIMLRARVMPIAKERKPFMIQRRLNRSDLKAMSAAHSVDQKTPQQPKQEKEGKDKASNYSPKARYMPKSPRKGQPGGEQKRAIMPLRKYSIVNTSYIVHRG